MLKEQVKNSILCDLRNGAIQPFQVVRQLQLKGVSSFEIEKIKDEILEAYEKERSRR